MCYIQPATFPGTYPTVSFSGIDESTAAAGLTPMRHLVMLVRFSGTANACIRSTFADAGFRRTSGSKWNVLWGSPLKHELFKGLDMFQRCNHFPGTWELGRKDRLYKCDHITLYFCGINSECCQCGHVNALRDQLCHGHVQALLLHSLCSCTPE